MNAWKEQNARRGLSPRQQRLLSLEALVEGTGYDHLQDWGAVDEHDNPIPCCQRAPDVQLGLILSVCLKLVRSLTGVKARPAIQGAEALATELAQLKPLESSALAIKDLVVKGSCAFGFARLGDAAAGPFEPLYLDSVWCEPVFACHAADARAEQIASELRALPGVPLTAPAPGEHLFVPPGSDSHDPIFLRHEWPVDTEIASSLGGSRTDTIRTWHRRDYLPNVIVEYEPIRVGGGDEVPRAWKVRGKPRPHNWGAVPVRWERSPWAKPGEIDGPSFIRPEAQSLSRAADYIESLGTDSVKKIAWPQLKLIDVQDKRRDINAEAAAAGVPGAKNAAKIPSASSYVLDVQTRQGSAHQGRAEVLEIGGDGPKVAAEHVERLRSHLERLTGMIEFDQAEAAGTLSGVALERMMQPYIDTINEWRVPVERLLLGVIRLLALVTGRELAELSLGWPDVIPSTPTDIASVAQGLATATGGQAVISQKTGMRLFAKLAGIDADEEEKLLAADAEASLARAREAMQKRNTPPPIPTDAKPAPAG